MVVLVVLGQALVFKAVVLLVVLVDLGIKINTQDYIMAGVEVEVLLLVQEIHLVVTAVGEEVSVVEAVVMVIP